jgi:ubiquinone/menaquinone biosynthesis C-methylase UbiE
MTASEEVLAGQAVYNRLVLATYDMLVLGLSCRLAWRCPKAEMLAQYDRNVGQRHLEIGVCTGYFLERCQFPDPRPRITLLDLNPTVLRVGAARLSRYRPTSVRADALQPLPVPAGQLDSVGMNFLLHCLPGDWPAKGSVFAHAAMALQPGGRAFGSTILGRGVATNPLARTLMRTYNRKGIFNNREDDLAGLEQQLASHFAEYRVAVRSTVALFEASTAATS